MLQSFGTMVSTSASVFILWLTFTMWTESCSPSTYADSGVDIVDSIRRIALEYGGLGLFRGYAAFSQAASSSRTLSFRSELQCSGVSLVDCPDNGKKKVARNMMIGNVRSSVLGHIHELMHKVHSGYHDVRHG